MEHKTSYWQMVNQSGQLARVDLGALFNESQIRCLDEDSEIAFATRQFESGRPLNIEGEIQMSVSPDISALNLYQWEGIVAALDVSKVLREIASNDIQVFAITYAEAGRSYEMINVIKSFDCLDYPNSSIRFHPKIRTKPMALFEIAIVEAVVRTAEIFRISNHLSTVIVSDRLRVALLEAGAGASTKFLRVTTT